MAPATPVEEDIEMGKRLLDEEKDAVKDTVRVQGGTRKQIIDGACIVLNIASTVTLVFLNKWCASSRVPTNKAILIFCVIKDISGSSIEDHADILRYVALHLHNHSLVDCEQISLSTLRSHSPTLPADDSAVFILCRVFDSRKLESGI